MMMKNRTREEFEKAGYTVIHIWKNLYLIRKYSRNYKRFSLYGLAVLKAENDTIKVKF